MASLKEVAELAGVSPSTVSIVLGGKAEERKISEATQKAVLDAARRCGYVPDISARRLRSSAGSIKNIALFGSTEFDPSVLLRFLFGLRNVIAGRADFDISIRLYAPGKLSNALSPEAMYITNAAIIFNTTREDMRFLEENSFNIPIIINNRESERHPSVMLDNPGTGTLPAEVFASRGHKKTQVVCYDLDYPNISSRLEIFEAAAAGLGLDVLPQVITTNTVQGGMAAGSEIAESGDMPDCIYCFTQRIACGVIRAFKKAGIRVPEDVEIICVGNGDEDFAESMSPSLSVVEVSQEEMARISYEKIMALMNNKETERRTIIPVRYISRESCGDKPADFKTEE